MLTAQRRIQIYNDQIAALDRLTPLLQKRVDMGASSPAEVARARVAVDLVRTDRERAVTVQSIARRELAIVMGVNVPDFSGVVGDLSRVGVPPVFQIVLKAIDINRQLMRWSAVWAQRDAELLIARLKPIQMCRSLLVGGILTRYGMGRRSRRMTTPFVSGCRCRFPFGIRISAE